MNFRCFIISVAFVICVTDLIEGSAIPMWEFLSRDEKMSHLYRIFSKQVAKYCADSSRPDCTKNLLVSGLRNLANMDEDYLDKMDPYQRNAKEIIWQALVTNNRFGSNFGENGDSNSSDRSDNENFATSDENGLAEESSAQVNDYVRPAGHTGPYLVGPMVIRVYPDGRPVPGDSKLPLPRDEDVDDLKYSKLPSIEEIESKSGSLFYGKLSSGRGLSSAKGNSKRPIYNVGQQKPNVILTSRRSSYYQQNNPIFDDRRNNRGNYNSDNYARNIRFY